MNNLMGAHRGDVGCGLLQLSDKTGGQEFSPDDAARLLELAAFAGATLDALRHAAQSGFA